MASKMADPVRQLEHTHGHLNELAVDVERLLAEESPAADARAELISALELLRDELLTHFANEEEALFPFIRANVPAKALEANVKVFQTGRTVELALAGTRGENPR